MNGAGHLILQPGKGAVLPVILQYPDFHGVNPGERVTGVTYDLLTVRYSILTGHSRGGVNQNLWNTKTLRAGVVGGVADSGSRTTLVDAALVQAEDWWNGALLWLDSATEGELYRIVNDFVAATDTLHFDPLHFEVVAADDFELTFWKELGHGVYEMPFSKDELGTDGLLVYHVELIADPTIFYTGSAQIDESLCLIKMKS